MRLEVKCNSIASWKQSDFSGNPEQVDLSSRWRDGGKQYLKNIKISDKLGNNILYYINLLDCVSKQNI